MKKWLIAAAGMCSSLSVTPLAERAGAYSIGNISFDFHPDTSIAFTKAPHHDGVHLDDGVEIRGEEVGVIDVLSSSVWELKNVALLRPVSSCDDPPEGQQDQYRVSVFKVNGNEPCADEPEKCVRYQGKVEARSSDFIDPDEQITMEGRFPCQLYVDAAEASCKGIGDSCDGFWLVAHGDECCSGSCSPQSGTNHRGFFQRCAAEGWRILKKKPLSQHTGTTRARTGADWHTHRLTTGAA